MRNEQSAPGGNPPGAELKVRELNAWFGEATALFGVDLDAAPGEIVGILGRNGAGKTTLLRSISGLHRSHRGSIEVAGRQVSGRPADAIARTGTSLVREGATVFATMTVAENLNTGAELARRRGRAPMTFEEIFDVFPALRERQGTKGAFLSGGQRQMLALARAFISRPRLLLLDEPSAGLAPVVTKDVFAAIDRIRTEGATVVLTEQNPHWLDGHANRVYLLDVGRVVNVGDLHQVLASSAAAIRDRGDSR